MSCTIVLHNSCTIQRSSCVLLCLSLRVCALLGKMNKYQLAQLSVLLHFMYPTSTLKMPFNTMRLLIFMPVVLKLMTGASSADQNLFNVPSTIHYWKKCKRRAVRFEYSQAHSFVGHCWIVLNFFAYRRNCRECWLFLSICVISFATFLSVQQWPNLSTIPKAPHWSLV